MTNRRVIATLAVLAALTAAPALAGDAAPSQGVGSGTYSTSVRADAPPFLVVVLGGDRTVTLARCRSAAKAAGFDPAAAVVVTIAAGGAAKGQQACLVGGLDVTWHADPEQGGQK